MLGGCATSIAEMPLAGGSNASASPRGPGDYLPVEDLPPARDNAEIAPAEQDKIKAELVAARNRQSTLAAAKDAPSQAAGSTLK
jgi:hypothetical protein